jgi:hypothetical protein
MKIRKHYIKPLFILALVCIQIYSYAQDTIYKRNGEILSAKIIEINSTEIKYQRADMKDGPLFVNYKNDIKKIKYAVGIIDSFSIVTIKPVPTKSNGVIYINKGSNQIEFAGRKGVYKYQGHYLSDRRLLQLAEDKNDSWKDKPMQLAIIESKKNKSLQYAVGFGGAGAGILSLFAGGIYADNNYYNDGIFPALVIINGVGLFVASQIISNHFKHQRVKQANKVAELYNQHL